MKKVQTSIALSKNDNILTSLDLLKKELSSLKTITESSYKTEGIISGTSIEIQKETQIDVLISLSSSVRARQNAYNEEINHLGLNEAPVFTIGNYTPDAIIHDVKLRLAVLKHTDRKKKLESLLEKGESFLTKEHQFELFQREIEQEISK